MNAWKSISEQIVRDVRVQQGCPGIRISKRNVRPEDSATTRTERAAAPNFAGYACEKLLCPATTESALSQSMSDTDSVNYASRSQMNSCNSRGVCMSSREFERSFTESCTRRRHRDFRIAFSDACVMRI